MYYAIHAVDRPGSLDARGRARPDHLSRLQQLRDEGRLLTAVPFPDLDKPLDFDQKVKGEIGISTITCCHWQLPPAMNVD